MIDASQTAILFIEDDPNDQILVRRAFNKCGIMNQLYCIDNGDSAVEILSNSQGDSSAGAQVQAGLVLLDLKLPRRSGLEVLEWIRGRPSLRRMPTVILTSSRQQEDIDRAYDLGANSYLVKPVDLHEFTELIRSVVTYWLQINQPPEQRPVIIPHI
jgi:CheY-like chemotaxis protein